MASIEIKPFRAERHVYLSNYIDEASMTDVQCDIQDILNDDEKIIRENCTSLRTLGDEYVEVYKKHIEYQPITLFLSGPGGNVYHGFGIYDYIKSVNVMGKQQIKIIINGYIASMATIIALASEDRVCTRNSSFMIHSISSWNAGKIGDLRDDLAESERLSKRLHEIYMENTKLTQEELNSIEDRKKDWWFDAEKALEIGLVKEII